MVYRLKILQGLFGRFERGASKTQKKPHLMWNSGVFLTDPSIAMKTQGSTTDYVIYVRTIASLSTSLSVLQPVKRKRRDKRREWGGPYTYNGKARVPRNAGFNTLVQHERNAMRADNRSN